MKSVTEFPTHKLMAALNVKNQLAGEGKTPEEIQASIGQTYKLEGDKLKFFWNAIEVASQNLEGLSRVLVVSLAEGENAPNKAAKIEEHHYVPDFISTAKPPAAAVKAPRGGPGGGKGGKDKKKGPRESPWVFRLKKKPLKKAKPLPRLKPFESHRVPSQKKIQQNAGAERLRPKRPRSTALRRADARCFALAL